MLAGRPCGCNVEIKPALSDLLSPLEEYVLDTCVWPQLGLRTGLTALSRCVKPTHFSPVLRAC